MLRYLLTLTATGCFVLISSCASSEPRKGEAPPGGPPGGGGQGCTPGESRDCFCPSGLPEGRQSCTAAGQLELCSCPSTTPPPSDQAFGEGQVCKELSDISSCVAEPHVSQQLPTSLLFVVDRSRSMLCNLPPLQSSRDCEDMPVPKDINQTTKWKVIQSALTDAIHGLPGGAVLGGLTFFSNNGECGVHSKPSVEIDLLDDVQRTSLSGAIMGTNPDGQTPIVGATILAYNHLHEEAMAPGNRFVVLITDGAESCAPEAIPQLLDVEVQKARDANIRTFVIGAPGSEQARAFLSELAFRGGTGRPGCVHDTDGPADQGDCHLDMSKSDDFAQALTAALGVVSSAAVGCDFPIPAGTQPTTDVNVQYTPSNGTVPTCFAPDNSKPCDGGANGWQFAKNDDGSDDLTRVVICGDACESIKSDPGARVDILVGCAPIVF